MSKQIRLASVQHNASFYFDDNRFCCDSSFCALVISALLEPRTNETLISLSTSYYIAKSRTLKEISNIFLKSFWNNV